MYTLKSENYTKCVGKGLPRGELTFNDYKESLVNHKNKIMKQRSIRSYRHKVYTSILEKKGLNCFDTKRYYFNKYESLPYFSSLYLSQHQSATTAPV
jgi:hypothetical protein